METFSNQEKLVVGIFHTRHEIKKAILILHKHGFPISRLSVIAESVEQDNSTESQSKINKNRILNSILSYQFIEEHFPWLVEHFLTGKYFLVAIGTSDEVVHAYGILVDAKAEIVNYNLTDTQD